MSKLMSLTIAVKPGDICWLARLSAMDDKLFVKVVEQQATEDVWRKQLFRIQAGEKADRIESIIKSTSSIRDVKILKSRDGFLYGIASVRCSRACGIEDAGSCLLRYVATAPNGEIIWNFIGTSSEFRKFLQRLTDRGIMYKTLDLSVVKLNGGLTSRQELLVKAALELGYFDYPKKIRVRELAQLFGVTPATVTEVLRKALRKIVKEYFSLVGGSEIPDEIMLSHMLNKR
jgi:predicted DNA binding protein